MGRPSLELSGHRFGRWLVMGKSHTNPNRQWLWNCQCDCGTKSTVHGSRLKQGASKSCGCVATERVKSWEKHGMANMRLYESWSGMMKRCFNPKNKNYKHYGGRGITVCERWMDIQNFESDMGERPIGHSIERINNEGNYEPGNCKWATRKEQNNNKRTNRNYESRYGKRPA